MKRALFILLALCLLLTMGCSKAMENASKKAVSMGEMKDHTYTNDYFGITFSIPDDWKILSEEEIEKLKEASGEIVPNEEAKEQMDLAEVKTLDLVYAFKYELNYTDGINPNMSCVGENLGLAGFVVKTPEDYLEQAQKLMMETGLPFELGEMTQETIGSKEFGVLESTIDMGIVIHQKFYVTIIDGYALIFTLTYSSDEERDELLGIIDTITFE